MVASLRGVPTERRKPCDCKYQCIKRVCQSVGTLVLSSAIFAIFDLERQLKLLEMAFDQVLDIPLSMGTFSYKT